MLLPASALVVVSALTKAATGWTAAGRRGVGPRGRRRAGAALIARGEFSIVIAGLGLAAGGDARLAPLATAYVLLTAVIGPIAARLADRSRPGPDGGAPRLGRGGSRHRRGPSPSQSRAPGES